MRALIIVDMQNDFMPTGELPVQDAFALIPIINSLMDNFDYIVATQDWHPQHHESFASNHQERGTGDYINLHGIQQILWPDHCVQNSFGAEFVDGLDTKNIQYIIQKGTNKEIDSYSGFFDNAHLKSTGLANNLKEKGINEVFIVGVATEYCVKYTALDAINLGFKTHVITNACRGVELHDGDCKRAFDEMESSGATLMLYSSHASPQH